MTLVRRHINISLGVDKQWRKLIRSEPQPGTTQATEKGASSREKGAVEGGKRLRVQDHRRSPR
jgi:hypothetical protein